MRNNENKNNPINRINPVNNENKSNNPNNRNFNNKIQNAFQILKKLGLKNFQNNSKKTYESKLHELTQLTNEKLKNLINNKYISFNVNGVQNSNVSKENFNSNKQIRNNAKFAELNNLKHLIESIKKNKNFNRNLYNIHPNKMNKNLKMTGNPMLNEKK